VKIRDAATGERHRSVEALAQALYEASDPGGIPWVKRTQVARDPWLRKAEHQVLHADDHSA
jgi:hypothetical protein